MAPTPDDPELFDLVDALLDDRLDPAGHAALMRRLRDDPDAQRSYLAYVDAHLALRRVARGFGLPGLPEFAPRERRARRPAALGAAALALAATAVAAATLALWRPGPEPAPDVPAPAVAPAVAAGGGPPDDRPRLVQSSAARFYGGRALPIGTRLEFGEEYALTAGQLELHFAEGAVAILDGPAVFAAAGSDRLHLKLGRCSVHAPPGAEGFRVETPVARVVDLGTRFSVHVADNGAADVQVVEGLAEVSPGPGPGGPAARLGSGEARRYQVRRPIAPEEIAFNPARYTPGLPDRVVSYEASGREGTDGAEDLVSVAVQRGGVVRRYPVEDLVGVEVIHYHSGDGRNNITTRLGEHDSDPGGPPAPRRADLLALDRNLNTGLINPGGSKTPLDRDPVYNDPQVPGRPNTPGVAVRFRSPVVNSDGPDVVVFELQVIVHPEKGDPFHVSPLRFEPGRKSHTVDRFDIDLPSPEARMLAGFRLYSFDRPARSLGELLSTGHNGGWEFQVRAKALAVGIDLSDLGYAPGEAAEGLFFQDTLDDGNRFDPVFIGGLPPVPDSGPAAVADR